MILSFGHRINSFLRGFMVGQTLEDFVTEKNLGSYLKNVVHSKEFREIFPFEFHELRV